MIQPLIQTFTSTQPQPLSYLQKNKTETFVSEIGKQIIQESQQSVPISLTLKKATNSNFITIVCKDGEIKVSLRYLENYDFFKHLPAKICNLSFFPKNIVNELINALSGNPSSNISPENYKCLLSLAELLHLKDFREKYQINNKSQTDTRHINFKRRAEKKHRPKARSSLTSTEINKKKELLETNRRRLESYYDAALSYEKGDRVPQDLNKAFSIYQNAANEGLAIAQYKVGSFYEHGIGTSTNLSAALQYYTLAANKGLPSAQYKAGYFHEHGIETPINLFLASQYYMSAANSGLKTGQYAYGLCLFLGKGVEVNFKSAFNFIQASADQDFIPAIFYLALLYGTGTGVKKDLKEAVRLHQKAAENGSLQAQYCLAVCYKKGLGVPLDISQARFWCQKAAGQGFTKAIKLLYKLNK